MSRLALFAFIVGLIFFVSANIYADTAKTTTDQGAFQIKEFAKDFKISKSELLNMIDTLVASGNISKEDAEKAKKEISALTDAELDAKKNEIVKKIPDNMTLDNAKKELKKKSKSK